MSVAEGAEIWNGRKGSTDERGVNTYTRAWRIRTNNTLDGPDTVAAWSGLPRRWQIYQEPNGVFDLSARCQKLDVQQDQDNPFYWTVIAEFTNQRLSGEAAQMANKGQTDDPLHRPTEIKIGSNRYTRTLLYDVNGKAIASSAGQFFKGVEVDDSRPTLVMIRNEVSPDIPTIGSYRDVLNSDSFMGLDAHKLKIASITADSKFEQQQFFFTVTYTFEINPNTWDRWFYDVGTYYIANGQFVNAKDASNRNVTSPVNLDGNGNLLAVGSAPVLMPKGSTINTYSQGASTNGYQVYTDMPFSVFNLP